MTTYRSLERYMIDLAPVRPKKPRSRGNKFATRAQHLGGQHDNLDPEEEREIEKEMERERHRQKNDWLHDMDWGVDDEKNNNEQSENNFDIDLLAETKILFDDIVADADNKESEETWWKPWLDYAGNSAKGLHEWLGWKGGRKTMPSDRRWGGRRKPQAGARTSSNTRETEVSEATDYVISGLEEGEQVSMLPQMISDDMNEMEQHNASKNDLGSLLYFTKEYLSLLRLSNVVSLTQRFGQSVVDFCQAPGQRTADDGIMLKVLYRAYAIIQPTQDGVLDYARMPTQVYLIALQAYVVNHAIIGFYKTLIWRLTLESQALQIRNKENISNAIQKIQEVRNFANHYLLDKCRRLIRIAKIRTDRLRQEEEEIEYQKIKPGAPGSRIEQYISTH